MAIKALARLQKLHEGTRAFLNGDDVPSQAGSKTPWWRRTGWFLLSVARSFVDNRCPVRASALAYTTLLALVPLLAVAIGVSTSLLKTQEGQTQIKEMVDKFVATMAPQLDLEPKTTSDAQANSIPDSTSTQIRKSNRQEVADKIFGFINNIQSGTLGTTGIIGLIIVAISLLITIESAFNDIWCVTHGRSWTLRIVYYWAAITLGPLILLVAIGLTTSEQFEATKQWISSFPWVGRFLMAQCLSLLPYIVLSLAFWGFYLVMPNTKVRWQAALVGGIVGGCLWQLNNTFNVLYVSKVVTYSKIYGSFALLPVFLIGLYFSWLILLLGAQVSYSFQNRHLYVQSRIARNITQHGREFVALRIMACIGARFQNGEDPLSVPTLAGLLDMPPLVIRQILNNLVQAGLLIETNTTDPAYAPGHPLSQISCDHILSALRISTHATLPLGREPTLEAARREFNRIVQTEHNAAAEINLESLIPPRSAGSKQEKV